MDDYVRGALTANEQSRFETKYLCLPGRAEKVAFARELVAAVSGKQSVLAYLGSYLPRMCRELFVMRAVPGWAFAAALLLAISSCSWLFLKNRELRTRSASVSAEIAELRGQDAELRGRLASASGGKQTEVSGHTPAPSLRAEGSPSALGLTLLPDSSRAIGRSMPKLDLTFAAIDLVIDSDDHHSSYSAELQTVAGEKVLDSPSLRRRDSGGTAMVPWQIPVRSLRPADYVIELKGKTPSGDFEQVQSYSLRVTP